MKRSYEQLKLYYKYIAQLRELDNIKVNVDGNVFMFRFSGLKNPRYLLKALDLELPIKNEHYPKSPNKNEFHDADMQDLTHHISWLRELLWDNKIVPFNDINLTKGL